MCPDATRTQTTTCSYPGCRKPVWQDPDGSFSSYCGKGHQDAMAAINSTSLCKNCLSRPVYVENGRPHDFCGRRCGTQFRSNGNQSTGPPVSRTPSTLCRLSRCQRPVFVDANGVPSQFCSNGHRREAVTVGEIEACLSCNDLPKAMLGGKQTDFCSQNCSRIVMTNAPAILPLNKEHAAFKKVADQFIEQWAHSTAKPTIINIWKIFGDKQTNDQFARYKLETERRTGQPGGNTRRRWHGTIRACRLGDQNFHQFCVNRPCSLCDIIRSSFQVAKAGERTNFRRFGAGIYTSATSSKANDYVEELGGSPHKAILMSNVVMGNPIKLTTDQPHLTEPPSGYDSVVGEPGGDLNYDESIVYNNDAIRPRYLVIYDHDPPRPLLQPPMARRNEI